MGWNFKDKETALTLKRMAGERKTKSQNKQSVNGPPLIAPGSPSFIVMLQEDLDPATLDDTTWTVSSGLAYGYRRDQDGSYGWSALPDSFVDSRVLIESDGLNGEQQELRVFNYTQQTLPKEVPLQAVQDVWGDLWIIPPTATSSAFFYGIVDQDDEASTDYIPGHTYSGSLTATPVISSGRVRLVDATVSSSGPPEERQLGLYGTDAPANYRTVFNDTPYDLKESSLVKVYQDIFGIYWAEPTWRYITEGAGRPTDRSQVRFTITDAGGTSETMTINPISISDWDGFIEVDTGDYETLTFLRRGRLQMHLEYVIQTTGSSDGRVDVTPTFGAGTVSVVGGRLAAKTYTSGGSLVQHSLCTGFVQGHHGPTTLQFTKTASVAVSVSATVALEFYP